MSLQFLTDRSWKSPAKDDVQGRVAGKCQRTKTEQSARRLHAKRSKITLEIFKRFKIEKGYTETTKSTKLKVEITF